MNNHNLLSLFHSSVAEMLRAELFTQSLLVNLDMKPCSALWGGGVEGDFCWSLTLHCHGETKIEGRLH